MRRARFADTLHLLATNEVEFILQGAPVTTLDLDVLHRRSPDNVARLLRVLAALDAVYRHDPRKLRPQESHLIGPGHQLLTTTNGDLDCLGTIDEGRTYEDVLDEAVEMKLSGGLAVRVLNLAALIEIKARSGRPKDLAVIPVLRATLDELNRRS